MKRTVLILLCLVLLLGLCACGEPEGSVSMGSDGVQSGSMDMGPASENDQGYVVPANWQEDSIDDGTYGYVTAAAELGLSGNVSFQDGYLVTLVCDQESQMTTLTRYTLEGTEISTTEIPPMEGSDRENTDSYIGHYSFGEDSIWITHDRYTIVDEETGETEGYTQLEQWSYDGECRTAIPLEDILLPEDIEGFVHDLAISPGGTPVFLTENHIYFCDGTGTPTTTPQTGGSLYNFCRDSSGRLYLNSVFENRVCTIDWDTHAPGESLFSTTGNETVLPGGGAYDFFLKSDTLLRGVRLETGTITTILSWSDWDLTGSVGAIMYLDQDTYLVTVYSLLNMDSGSQLLSLTRVPANEIPEKTVVRLAVGLDAEAASWGQTWTDALDQKVAEAINQFNRASSAYRVEVETYSSGEELSLKLVSGDAPDIIDWNTTAWLEDTPSLALYAKRGYLLDLEPLFATDEELSTDDFIPNILELVKGRTNGLYSMPLNFYFVTMTAPKAYVGDQMGWTVSDLLEVAKTLPEDMGLWEYTTQSNMLDTLLRTNINSFVNLTDGTCDFENQDFYDILTLCRDYFPAEAGETYIPPAGGSLLTGQVSMGRLGQFASDVMWPLEEQGQTMIGYPGAAGNGLSIIFNDEMAICALGQQQAGAWEFLRTLFTYDFQYSGSSIMCAVRQDTFDAKEDWYLKVNSSCTEAESMAARELVYGAKNVRVNDSPTVGIVLEEAEAFFAGDKTAEETARLIQSRVEIYLGEQS